MAPGIRTMTPDGAVFEGGDTAAFDAVIFATGYRPNFQALFEDVGASADPSVHFIGFAILQ